MKNMENKFMRGKIKKCFPTFSKIIFYILNNWIKIAEIATVIWAVNGIMQEYSSWRAGYHITPVWAYFLSAVLVLYLLRKYGKSNTPRT